MASAVLEMLKNLWESQVTDEENRAFNYRILKAVGLFAGSIAVMHNFGELMNI
ncbi:mitochondrial import receptor subunit TOM5 homolog [Oryza sativa Japonica Group]|jgi:hypothetical protein|uniref:Os03g0603500 protein n=1 Tax=Oryza sativa subsp. japonica TaxID=39947 RepID=A0A0P0W0M6_ORYSJ|nr:mitochondrial import receptor subunit TOM5 homolog [Oryza sativa Japonica Group]KAB8092582.1 hypothetical protein EE612_018814 [Oryza sativa]KAF2940161.1 hypothetical protein DAI22_03g250400 [Oryza sativa Japonica Group]BAS85210.1 Os03g0603500 [Oryza sativa Japonica Group]